MADVHNFVITHLKRKILEELTVIKCYLELSIYKCLEVKVKKNGNEKTQSNIFWTNCKCETLKTFKIELFQKWNKCSISENFFEISWEGFLIKPDSVI